MTDFSPEDLAFVIKIGQIVETGSASAAPAKATEQVTPPTDTTPKAEA